MLSQRQIICYPSSDSSLDTITHLLLDQVLPSLAFYDNVLVIHAGAVAINQQAIGFLGATGLGKSTLVTSFCKAGYPLITDDCLALEVQDKTMIAHPGYASLRLWDDSVEVIADVIPAVEPVAHYTPKKRLDITDTTLRFCDHPLPLKAIYVLSDPQDSDDGISITPIAPREAMITLLEATFKLDPTDKQQNRRDFETYVQIVNQVPIYKLNYPRRYDVFDAVHQLILDTIDNV